MVFGCKDLLGLQGMDKAQIELILDQARIMHRILESDHKRTPHLQGKSIVTLFYENSTRTRMSFELASKYLKMCIRDRLSTAAYSAAIAAQMTR